MAALVKKGIVDFIGAARPSIADPFLPTKIKEGRTEDIRECIGCNICVACDNLAIPIRCTQNPTMGEEWRRGWHPEKIQRRGDEETALVVGSGPAGLECAMQLERRGYRVTLAEANKEFGGRAIFESRLKGLNAWRRVADYRVRYLQQSPNIDLFLESKLSAENVIELGIKNIFLATGSRWRSDGVGRSNRKILSSQPINKVFTPDDIMAGTLPKTGPLVIYDDDQIYLGGVLAEHLSDIGLDIVFVTPANNVSPWCENTLEQHRIQKSLINKNIDLKFGYIITGIMEDKVQFECNFSGKKLNVPAQSVLLVTERSREITLYDDLVELVSEKNSEDFFLKLVGDAAAPGLIADAIFDGHLAARNFERDDGTVEKEFYIREIISLE
jgi:dimethylamine/trimethylamine dehydrogenase